MRNEARVEPDDPAYAGQASYTAAGLNAYDFLIFRVNMPIFWRCRKEQLLGMYDAQAAARHLDVGVATGALLDDCRFPAANPEITLMDLNPESLAFAAHRLRRYTPATHQANILNPWGLPPASFESVAMMNVLHCVPGTIKEKAVSFDHARSVLAPGGTLFGATVLGEGVSHTRKSRWLLNRMNRTGKFTNLDDSLEDLRAALTERFPVHQLEVHGAVACFVAKAKG